MGHAGTWRGLALKRRARVRAAPAGQHRTESALCMMLALALALTGAAGAVPGTVTLTHGLRPGVARKTDDAEQKQCNWTLAPPVTILPGYAIGYNPAKQPYPNTLEAAQAWCCAKGASVCGGVTHQEGKFDARHGCGPRGCSSGFDCKNTTSWILQRSAHDGPCPAGPAPSPPPGPTGPPPVDIPVWPIPTSVTLLATAGLDAAVAPTFAITVSAGAPSPLVAAAVRYQTIIRKSAAVAATQSKLSFAHTAGGSLAGATVQVTGNSTSLTFETDYSYALQLPGGSGGAATAIVSAANVFGAMYGLETLAQLVSNGTLGGKLSGATISDAPMYRYRGLMLDTGRRFIPKPDILNSLEAMAATKMNVLHLHLSDDQRCAVDSTTFANLTGHLKADPHLTGSYTHQDVADIITFANARGILVIPEIDLPGHANGLLPLKGYGATFCADSQMYSDSAGKTNEVLSKLVAEYAALFGSQTFHLGCDETSVKLPLCTIEATKAVEVAVSESVSKLQNDGAAMWPMGWEEFHWRTNASDAVGPGPTGAIIEAWSRYKAADVIKEGYRAVEADGGRFYLNHLHPTASQWLDIGVGITTPADKELMLGGEIAMWTLEYREGACKPVDTHGCGVTQFAPSADHIFSQSFGGIVWPRAAVGGAAFWNFNSTWAFSDLEDRYVGFAAVLEARGLKSCPAECAGGVEPQCDYGYACGVPYS